MKSGTEQNLVSSQMNLSLNCIKLIQHVTKTLKSYSISNIQSFLGNNIDLCFEAYQKKQEFFGAQLFVETSNCTSDSVFADKNSFVVVERTVQ